MNPPLAIDTVFVKCEGKAPPEQARILRKGGIGGTCHMRNKPRVILAQCLILFATVSILIGSSCRPKQQQATTLRVWQTEVDPKAVAVLKDIGAEFERTHPGVRVELESVAWGALSAKLTTACCRKFSRHSSSGAIHGLVHAVKKLIGTH